MKIAIALSIICSLPSLLIAQPIPFATDGILGVELAPGKITTLSLTGVTFFSLPSRASNLPLPTTLAGISIALRQFTNSDWIPVPILSVQSRGNGFVDVIIQVPYGLTTCCGINGPPSSEPPYRNQIMITENGTPGQAWDFTFRFDRIHIVNYCDPGTSLAPGLYSNGLCGPVVKHADGTPVLGGAGNMPAQPGEILTLYAYGLGETSPPVTAGKAAPSPPALKGVGLTFNFTPNAAPSAPGPDSSTLVNTHPEFAGLVPGYAGLYQVNFKVPPVPSGTTPCLAYSDFGSALTNVTVTLSGTSSFDGAGFCVQVPAAPSQSQNKGR